jgi:prepilin-type processing-associated H-X9-DG protein
MAELPLIMDSIQRLLPPNEPFITWAYSSHMNPKNGLPSGGNTLYGDGHVEWKPFDLRSAIQIMWSSNLDHERWW